MRRRIRELIQEARDLVSYTWMPVVSGPHPSTDTWDTLRKEPSPPPAQGLPFRSRSAELVFIRALELAPEYPELDESKLLRQAIRDLGIPAQDLTAEDIRLIEMGLELHMNGPPPAISRTGGGPGSPGGPMRHTGPNVSRAATVEHRIRSAAKFLREFMAHPQALGTTGMFSGGQSLPYPGSSTFTKRRLWDDEAPNPWEQEPEPSPDELIPKKNPWSILLQPKKRSRKKGRRVARSQ